MAEQKKGFLSGFEVTDRASCEKVIRNGGIAGLVTAGITAVFAVIGLFTQTANTDLNYLLDPWMLVDVVLILILAYFVFRKSRVASTMLFVYFVASKIIMWIEVGAPKGALMAIVFLLYYGAAMRATYIWHSKYRSQSGTQTLAQVGG